MSDAKCLLSRSRRHKTTIPRREKRTPGASPCHQHRGIRSLRVNRPPVVRSCRDLRPTASARSWSAVRHRITRDALRVKLGETPLHKSCRLSTRSHRLTEPSSHTLYPTRPTTPPQKMSCSGPPENCGDRCNNYAVHRPDQRATPAQPRHISARKHRWRALLPLGRRPRFGPLAGRGLARLEVGEVCVDRCVV